MLYNNINMNNKEEKNMVIMRKMSILDAVVAGFLGGMIDGCIRKRRKRNCPYSY